TIIPSSITDEQVRDCLKIHELMIKTSATKLISCELQSGDPGTTATYAITDDRAFGTMTYKATMTSIDEGIDTFMETQTAIGRMAMRSRWRVVQSEGTNVLKEEVD